MAGGGVIFIDSADDDDEQRLSLAHELAHYLRDYWEPRLRISECMAEDAIEVIDGQRPAAGYERWQALLAACRWKSSCICWNATHVDSRSVASPRPRPTRIAWHTSSSLPRIRLDRVGHFPVRAITKPCKSCSAARSACRSNMRNGTLSRCCRRR